MTWIAAAFATGRQRQLTGHVSTAVRIYAAAVALWTVYAAIWSYLDVLALTMIFLAQMLVLVFALITPGPSAPRARIPWYDAAAALAAVAAGLHFVRDIDAIAQRITLLTPLSAADLVFGTIYVLLALEATRRTVGFGLTAVVVSFMVYNLFGHRLEGMFQHGYISPTHFIDIMVLTTDGLFGVPLRVAATYAFLFVLFGTVLAKTGGSQFFFDLAAVIAGRSPGGPAKISVISSGVYGTLSGSPTSDVVTTGAVTIPLMRRLGYSGGFAGGVEVAASTGGSLLPPVMGSAAFIMAEYTGIAYVDIAVAGLVPALLYYLCVYAQVDFRARRLGLAPLAASEIPPIGPVLRAGWMFVVPLVVLTVALFKGYTPTYVAAFATATIVVIGILKPKNRLGPVAIFDCLAETTIRMVAVTAACAAAGLVIGGITMTGLAGKFSHLVVLVADANLFFALLFGALLTLLLGLGMPTPSAYILAAVLVAPTLVDLGLDLMAAHLFLLYFAVMSAMTPPVAVAAYAASAISGTNPFAIALSSVRLAIAAYVMPFAFVYGAGLLLAAPLPATLLAVTTAALGAVLLAAAVEGFVRRPLSIVTRVAFAAAALCLVAQAGGVWLAAAALLVAVGVVAQRRRAPHGAAPVPAPPSGD